ncbi:MAG: hypothetical protein EA417_15540 [Gammaproteobacteria bacterium]|nr:MAG: hypothetical protein EA417_15540 [Gammaproteobacteria bacterium]
MRRWIAEFWRTLSRPSRHFSLDFLALGGFVTGILFWVGFNTAMKFTNTETFYIDCHKRVDHRLPDITDVPGW